MAGLTARVEAWRAPASWSRSAAGESSCARRPATGRRSAPARLSVELVRLAPRVRAAPRPPPGHVRLPRLRPLRQAARPSLLAARPGRPGPEIVARYFARRAGGARRARHGLVGRDRAAGSRPRRAAAVRARPDAAVQRQPGARAREPADRAEDAAQPARADRRAADERALVQAIVRRDLLRRAPAQPGGGGRPMGAARAQRRTPDPRPADLSTSTSASRTPTAGTARYATGAGGWSSPGPGATRSAPRRCCRRCSRCGRPRR